MIDMDGEQSAERSEAYVLNDMKFNIKISIIISLLLLLILLFFPKKISKNDTNLSFVNNVNTVSDPYFSRRQKMVETQLKRRDIYDKQVLEVMAKVPRHKFLTQNLDAAYDDYPLPIGFGQTISQPYIVALMTQTLNVKPTDKVLEIGTGSGYQTAVLSELTKEVYTIEIIDELTQEAARRLKQLGYTNVKVKNSDGYFGWKEMAPFDKIIITAAVNHIPPPLTQQLADGGKLIIPLGSTLRFQTLTLVIKNGEELRIEYITGVRFVPLTGYAEKVKE